MLPPPAGQSVMDTSAYRFVVYDADDASRAELHAALTEFSIREDVDLQIDWLFRREQENQLPQLAGDAQIALVSAQMGEASLAAGRCILEENPDCLLVYYGARPVDWTQLLAARPIAYQDRPESPEAWRGLLSGLCAKLAQGRCFSWGGKARRLLIPCRAISHIQSDRASISVYACTGSVYRLPGKLDEAEKLLPPGEFLRVHKSALVNLRHVQLLDRGRKCVVLENGTEVYISKAHYRETLERICQRGGVSLC